MGKKEMLTSPKLKVSWYKNIYFLKVNMCVYVHAKFEVSSIILTSFRYREREDNFTPPTSKSTKKPIQIRVKTSMLRSDSCEYSDAFIGLKGKISDTGTNADNILNKKLSFQNNYPFRSCM